LTYTRSIVADYSAYYEAGVKLTWTPSQAVTTQFLVINEWQDISNYNTPPAVGARIDYVVSPELTVSYDNFLGIVSPDTVVPQVRFYNDWIVQYSPTARWQLAATVDLGVQSRMASAYGTATWDGAALIAKYHATPKVGIVGRIERYADPSRVIVQTNLPGTFEASGASLGVDVSPVPRLLWRTRRARSGPTTRYSRCTAPVIILAMTNSSSRRSPSPFD
jgi:putative OmpL-like beta-barrel porin-2